MPVTAQANQGFESIVLIVFITFVAITTLLTLIISAKYFQLWLQSFLRRRRNLARASDRNEPPEG